MDTSEIDPVRYGVLWEKVQALDKKIDKMERQLELLLELANKGKGGFWAGMVIASAISGLMGYLLTYWSRK